MAKKTQLKKGTLPSATERAEILAKARKRQKEILQKLGSLKKKRDALQKKPAEVVEEYRDLLDGFKLPAPSALNAMNLFKLDKLVNETMDALDDAGALRFHSMKDILGAYMKKPYDLCGVRNRRVQQAAFSSPKWKAYVKDVSAIELRGHALPIEKKKITLTPPFSVAENALKKVFADHLDSQFGHDSLVELAPSGAIKKLVLWETTDREVFFENVIAQSMRKHKGGAPQYSANIFPVGTVAIGPSGERYVSEAFRGAKRWVKVK